MNFLRVILLSAFLFSGLSGFAEDDKGDFTLVNKHELAERKKTWQKAVTEKAILTKENEKMTAAMKAQSEELDRLKSDMDAVHRTVRTYKNLVNLLVYQQPRIWKSNAGKALQAILIEDDGESVRLKTGLDSEVSISRDGLSKRDIKFLNELREAEDAAEPAPEEYAEEEDEEEKAEVSEEDQFQKEIEKSLNTVL